MEMWLYAIGGLFVVVGVITWGCLWITGDDYRAQRVRGRHPDMWARLPSGEYVRPARHRAEGLDDPTTQIDRGTARVSGDRREHPPAR